MSEESASQDPPGIFVRDYTVRDREAVLLLWEEVFRATLPVLEDAPTEEDFCTYFDQVIVPSERIWVAVREDEVIGFVSAREEELLNLFVRPDHQRRGVGTLLLGHALRAEPRIARLSTVAENHAARQFYRKNGFVLERIEPHTLAGHLRAIYRLG